MSTVWLFGINRLRLTWQQIKNRLYLDIFFGRCVRIKCMHINIKTYKNLLYLWFIIEVSTDRHFWFYFYPFSSMQVTRSTELARKTPKMCSWCWVSVMSGKYQGCEILPVIFLEAGTPSIGINISIVCWPNLDKNIVRIFLFFFYLVSSLVIFSITLIRTL